MRFSLIDRIDEMEAGRRILAVKNLSLAEEYLGDHFPGFPVMPGVLMVESLVQAGAWLMRYTTDFRYSAVLLKEARAVKFNNFVSPGKTLVITCEVIKQSDEFWTFKSLGTVDGESAVSAKVTLTQFNLATKDASLAKSDAYRIEKLREQFGSIWRGPAATV